MAVWRSSDPARWRPGARHAIPVSRLRRATTVRPRASPGGARRAPRHHAAARSGWADGEPGPGSLAGGGAARGGPQRCPAEGASGAVPCRAVPPRRGTEAR